MRRSQRRNAITDTSYTFSQMWCFTCEINLKNSSLFQESTKNYCWAFSTFFLPCMQATNGMAQGTNVCSRWFSFHAHASMFWHVKESSINFGNAMWRAPSSLFAQECLTKRLVNEIHFRFQHTIHAFLKNLLHEKAVERFYLFFRVKWD